MYGEMEIDEQGKQKKVKKDELEQLEAEDLKKLGKGWENYDKRIEIKETDSI